MEHFAYRENLEQVLAFTGGRQMLRIKDVQDFTGIQKYETLHKRFPFVDGYISAATFAKCLCGTAGRK
jgi:hypothetical protein